MKDSIYYFNESVAHQEPTIDLAYSKIVSRRVIPEKKGIQNDLISSNAKVIRYISSIETLSKDLHDNFDGQKINEIISLIIKELHTEGMNLTAFCQYLNVHNVNYSLLSKLPEKEQAEILKIVVKQYIEERHDMYLSHGYSDIVMQVMSDNYSHKRKGSYGAEKIKAVLSEHNICEWSCGNADEEPETYFMLSDKTGKKLFRILAEKHKISLAKDGQTTEKFPDAFIRLNKNYFIVEHKNMKEIGGGQDKQTLEITDFINRKPEFDGLHYITYMDGVYFNGINANATGKQLSQYKDIVSALKNHDGQNYFVNTYGFNLLIDDILAEDVNLKPNKPEVP